MDDVTRAVRDEDFFTLRDEDLVGLVRRYGWRVPLDALLERCEEQIWNMIPGSMKMRLSQADLDDLMQVGMRASFEAIEKYNLEEIQNPDGCQFHSFLAIVAKRRLSNAFRDWEHYEARRDPDVRWDEEVERRAAQHDQPGFDFLLSREEQTNPLRAAEVQEFHAHLQEEISHLNELEALLWKEWWAGTSVRESARKAGLSEGQTRRIRDALLARLRVRLRDVGPEADD